MQKCLNLVLKFLFVLGFLFISISSNIYAKEPIKETQLTLMLDWFINPNHGPIIIAKQKGLFKQRGLDVKIQEPADPSLPPKLAAANKVDIAITYEPNFIIDISKGLPIRFVTSLIRSPLNTLLVKKDSSIKHISDLKNKKIGTSVTGVERAMLRTILQTGGLKLSDVELVNVGWNISAALASEQVDAIFGGLRNFEPNQLLLEGVETRVFKVEDYGIPSYDELVFVTQKDSYKKEALQQFIQAIIEASQYISKHPNESWQLFKTYQKSLDTKLNQKAWFDTVQYFTHDNTVNREKNYQYFTDFLFENHEIDQSFDISNYLSF